MTTYRKHITIEDPQQLVLSDLPFQAGQQVEIVILSSDSHREALSQKLQNLFKKTQSLPGAKAITEEDIAAEIKAYRQGE